MNYLNGTTLMDVFRKPTLKRIIQDVEQSILLEKQNLLKSQQAKDYADTDIAYRMKRIASLSQSLKDLKNEQTSCAINNAVPLPILERRVAPRAEDITSPTI